jgi:hypothetical protein
VQLDDVAEIREYVAAKAKHASEREQQRYFFYLVRFALPDSDWRGSSLRGEERILIRRATRRVMLAELFALDHTDDRPPPTGRDDEVAPLVTQLVGSLSEAPASPPALRVALAAA